MEEKITTHFTKGLIIGLLVVTMGFTFQMFDLYEKWVQWLSTFVYFAAIIWACISFSRQMKGNVRFGEIFSHGFKTVAIVTLIGIAAFIVSYFLMPELKQKAMEIARADMAKNKDMNQELIDQAMSWADKLYFVGGIVGSLFLYAFSGAIASLIGAAVAKKNSNPTIPKSL
jgi:hypothetical protein